MDWESFSDKFGTFGEKFGEGLLRMFGSQNERSVRRVRPIIDRINQLEEWAKGLEAHHFPQKTAEWKALFNPEMELEEIEAQLEEILPEAFALVREASVRTLGLRHYDVQLVGGYVLHQGSIAEMATGEGKTLAATLPLYLNALSGRSAFLVTVNDYLARRDAQWMSPVYEYMGMTVASIQAPMTPAERLPVYASDIVYGTNNEFGFDYLRDNMKTRVEEQVQRELAYAIVDEVDSILIDESRTPLIISGPAELTPDKYVDADRIARQLVRDEHFEVKEKERSASLLEDGIAQAQDLLGVESFYDAGYTDWPHYLENSLRAHHVYQRDREYVVEPGETGEPEVVIVDEFTGRKMAGRRWSDGLHQAVEAKEGLRIRQENQTLATITFQNYFRLYGKLAGMTGTAITEAGEFKKIYDLDVVSIPTNVPIARDDRQDVVYRTEPEKWKAIVDEIKEVHATGQPILVGTTSVENSEKVSQLLTEAGVEHEVLNAKNHEREATIVARAGERGSVTVSTNMAGRGTDIKLGGNFEFRLAEALEEAGMQEGDLEHLDAIARIRAEVRAKCDRDEAEVLELGGLYVLGTERHESRRIDNQLRGRSGRQGNAGESRFFLSLQDPLMKRFYKDWVVNAMERLGMEEGVPIESGMVTRAVKNAQKKVEEYYFEIRKNLLEYDEVMDQQRKTIYFERQEVLEGIGLQSRVKTMVDTAIDRASQTNQGDPTGFANWFLKSFGVEVDEDAAEQATARGGDTLPAKTVALDRYDERLAEVGEEAMRRVDRYLLLNTLDAKWKDHLHAIDALRAGIGLRGYAQKDPKNEYKAEAYDLFQKLLQAVEDEVASLVLRVRIAAPAAQAEGEPADGFGDTPDVYSGAGRQSTAVQQGDVPAPDQAPLAPRDQQVVRKAQVRPPAAAAFDVARRQAAVRAAQERQQAPAAAAAPAQPAVDEVGRNEPCPCGSGKKYKKCHGAN
ncbi:preprotein translocase subunit SecA [Planctomycetes bacterium Pla86]|uniref:Protein translocase subunit SecA n=2 Tax=Engelhardtia mirabilis TaxID=2528011 RepID=A0A518BLQ6_9BACT|nr:preprotein translocase subunit SecA [Planctomycetes bacterium Pla133]QDV02235.1 preprotein translocase subunit SecA [Planctomycetes bacterium Pla86]